MARLTAAMVASRSSYSRPWPHPGTIWRSTLGFNSFIAMRHWGGMVASHLVMLFAVAALFWLRTRQFAPRGRRA